MLEVQIKGAEELRKVARALRRADKVTLGRELSVAIRDAGEATVRDIADSARTLKTTGVRKPGAKHPFDRVMPPKGTREEIAGAVTLEVRVSEEEPRVRFSVPNRQLPARLRNMPQKFDSGQPWRHPVLGHREVWVAQVGGSWFWPPIRRRISTFREHMSRAIERIKAEIERAT